jgi:hypothetical protein
MREFLAVASLSLAMSLAAAASEDALLERAWAERDRTRELVEAGVLPQKALAEAERHLEEAADEAVLRRTLYGALELGELTQDQAEEMVRAAERRLERSRERLERLRRLVEEGALPARALEEPRQELLRRERTLELARRHAQLFEELLAGAQAEAALAGAQDRDLDPAEEMFRWEGRPVLSASQFDRIRRAFERRFNRPLPVSANGDTAVHRALGFDHRGRVDVALHPDQPEGRWLLELLERLGVPYYAFRSSVPGKSTGAHIHLGPPSTRLRTGD